MTDQTTLETLAELLDRAHATPVIQSTRLAPSTIYDIDYRVAIVACAFDTHSTKSPGRGRRIRAIWLKLVQFVATRPWLLPVFQNWVAGTRNPQQDLLMPQSLRRGFIDDRTHDSVVSFLTAYGAFRREKGFLIASARSTLLSDWVSAAKEDNLFEEERRVLKELTNTKPTVRMLEEI